jgi:signal transduction histidine kinase
MRPPRRATARFRDSWSLHVVRYAALGFAVLAWLWAPTPQVGLPVAIAWTSLALLLDPWLHGPERSTGARWLALAQAAAASAALRAAPGLPTAVVAAVVIAGVAAALPPRWRDALVVGVVVATGPAAATALGLEALLTLLPAYALAYWMGVHAASQAREAQAHEGTVAELEAAQERLAALAEAGREGAVERERQRIAADVHDTLGHALMAMLMQVQVARRVIATDPGGAAQRLETVEADARATLDRVRSTLRRTLDDGLHIALPTAIEHVTCDFEQVSATAVDLTFVPSEAELVDVDRAVSDALLRTVREALTNAVRHGRATRVRVELEAVGARLHLRIDDDGLGTDVTRPGMGLAGMVARIQAVGGSIRFDSSAGRGFRVEVAVRRR